MHKLLTNYYGRIFNFTGSVSRAFEILSTLSLVDGPSIYLNALGIAKEIGRCVRILFGYTARLPAVNPEA